MYTAVGALATAPAKNADDRSDSHTLRPMTQSTDDAPWLIVSPVCRQSLPASRAALQRRCGGVARTCSKADERSSSSGVLRVQELV